jgi:hypothetical protein
MNHTRLFASLALISLSACNQAVLVTQPAPSPSAISPSPSATPGSVIPASPTGPAPQTTFAPASSSSALPGPFASVSPELPLRLSLPLQDLITASGLRNPRYLMASYGYDYTVGELGSAGNGDFYEGAVAGLPAILPLVSEGQLPDANYDVSLTLWGGDDSGACNYRQYAAKGKFMTAQPDSVQLRIRAADAGTGPVLDFPESGVQDKVTLLVNVRDNQGQLIPKATLRLSSSKTDTPVYRAEVSQTGAFFFATLTSVGEYDLLISAPGYANAQRKITLVSEKNQPCRNDARNRQDIVLTKA